MHLLIDPTEPNAVRFVVSHRGTKATASIPLVYGQHEPMLAYLDSFLKKNRIALPSVTTITVVNGPGKFSALRVASVIANTIAFQTGAQLFVLRKGGSTAKKVHQIEPFYGKPPHITKPKKRQEWPRRSN